MKNQIAIYNLAEIKVSYTSKIKYKDRQRLSSSKDAEVMFRKIWNPTMELREEFYILLLNRANVIIGWHCISQGGVTGTVVDPKLVFSIALKCMACGIILGHNHPSGNLNPSEADIQLTKKLQDGGKLLDIVILDHLIITNENYFSLSDEGIVVSKK